MQNARELLSTGKFSVSETAELCGFANVCYFSRVFKETQGISPTQYIKESGRIL